MTGCAFRAGRLLLPLALVVACASEGVRAEDAAPDALPTVDALLAAHDEHQKAFTSLRISWIEVAATHDTRRVYSVEESVLERTGDKASRRLTAIDRPTLRLEMPAPVGDDPWWERLRGILRAGDAESGMRLTKPLFDRFKGRRHTYYLAYPERDDWYGVVEDKPFMPAGFAEPLLPAHFYAHGVPLADGWRAASQPPVIVRTGFGRVAVLSSRVKGDGVLHLLSAEPGHVADERLLWRGLSVDEMRAMLVAAGSAEDMRRWPEILGQERVLRWLHPEGLPPVPEIVHRRMSAKGFEAEEVWRVTAVSKGPDDLSVDGFPAELRGQRVDVFDKVKHRATRHHPDGRVEVLMAPWSPKGRR